MLRIPRLLALLAILLGLGLASQPTPAYAAFITVTTTADGIDAAANCGAVTLVSLPGPGGATSLREAICAANNNLGADTISFSVNGTFILTGLAGEDAGDSGDLDIIDSLIINGNGINSTIIDGGGIERIFDVFPSSPITFELNNLTLQNGDARNTTPPEGGAVYLHNNVNSTFTNLRVRNNFAGANGAIENRGTLSITDSEISGNQTIPPSGTVVGGGIRTGGPLTLTRVRVLNNSVRGEGGGLFVNVGSGVTVSIVNSEFSGNSATITGGGLGNGGAIATTGNEGTLSITNSTISGNRADNQGGGIYFATPSTGNATITNVTITQNHSDNNNAGGDVGGGLRVASGSVTLRNTIVAENYRGSGTGTTDNVNGVIGGSNNLTTGSPLLGPLANNGGSTQTHALLPGSPAIDTGTNSVCPLTDQRGTQRPLDGDGVGGLVCDIGAYELIPDTTPPDTTINSNPTNPSNDPTPTFSFTGSDNLTPPASLTFECRIGAASFSACTSPATFGPLADGSHTFEVRAVDQTNNVDPTPASFTWVIDATAPNTTITDAPSDPSNSPDVSFSFNGSDGSGVGVVDFLCRIDSGGFSACTSPWTDTGLADGSHTFEVRAIDAASNVDPTPASFTWVIDTTAPNTTITDAPSDPSNSPDVSFSFNGSDGSGSGVAGFQCQIDGGGFSPCTSPWTDTGLADGSHTFEVQAIDAAGNIDATPASFTWVIDATPPPAPVLSTPANGSLISDTTPTFSGTAEAGSTVTVIVDGTPAGTATADGAGNWDFTPAGPLSQGMHSVRARAADAAGNISPNSNTNSFTVDSIEPDTTITDNPPDPSNSADASFSFIGDDSGGTGVAGFECSLDGAAFAACTSPQDYSNLDEGSHTFEVRAIDNTGNLESPPASYTWIIDLAAPETTITSQPANPSNSPDPSFTFVGNDTGGTGIAGFECSLDGAAFAACTSPQNYTGLADGSYTFEVRAIDNAGNVDPDPASYTWTIDATAPTVTVEQATAQADPTNASPIEFTVTFSEPVTGFTEADVQLGGTAGATTAVVIGSGANYTIRVSGMTSDGTVIASLLAGAASDAAGNPSAASTSTDNTVTYDTTAPTVTVEQAAGQADPANASPIEFTVTFSEPVTGFTEADVQLGGTAGATTVVVNGSGASYTIAVSGMTSDGTVIASLLAGAASDAAGNTSAASTSADNTVTYDATAPTVTVEQALAQADPTNASPIEFIVTFSEPVTGFTEADVQLGGTAGATTVVVNGSGASYTIAVSGMTSDGTVIASLLAGAASDSAGNPSAASTSTDNTVTYDTTAPTVSSIVRADANPTNAATVEFTVTLDEAVIGLDASNFALTTAGVTGAIIDSVSGSGTTWTVSVDTGSGDGSIRLDLDNSTGATDAAGNPIAGLPFTSGETYTIDKTAPTVTVEQAVGQADPANTSPINFTVEFSEPVSNFTGGVALSGTAGATTATISGSGTTYNVAVSGMTADGTVIASLLTGAASDAAGNPSVASTSTDNEVIYDVSSPTPTIASAIADPTNTSPILVAVTFDEPVTGFDETDLVISNGSAGPVSGSGASYSFDLTPASEGLVSVDIAAGAAVDQAGNPSQAADQFTITYDITDPTVTVEQAPDQADPTAVAPIRFIATFSEPVAGFDDADVGLGGTAGASSATVTEIAPNDGTTYAIAVGGMTSGGTVTASIAAGAVADLAGNPVAASTSTDNSVTFDPVAPVVTGVARVDANPSNAANVRFSVTFSKPVSGVDPSDFSLAITGDLSGAAVTSATSAGGTSDTWTITVATGSGGGSLRLDLVDDDSIVDNVGLPLGDAGSGNGDFSAGQSYTIDKEAPTAGSLVAPDISTPGASTYEFTLVYSDNLALQLASLDDNDIQVTGPNGFSQLATLVATTPNSDGTPIQATYQISAPGGTWDGADNGDYTIALVAGQVRDTAGNTNLATELGGFNVELPVPTTLFLPLLANSTGLPDLVIERLSAGSNGVELVIKNQGQAAVTDPFWVDVYINPSSAPTGVNQTWPQLAQQGLVWGVNGGALPLEPGESLTLRINDAYYRADLSVFSGQLAQGTPVYAQVDSANTGDRTGGVLESHEAFGGAYNNIARTTATSDELTKRSSAPTGIPKRGQDMPARP